MSRFVPGTSLEALPNDFAEPRSNTTGFERFACIGAKAGGGGFNPNRNCNYSFIVGATVSDGSVLCSYGHDPGMGVKGCPPKGEGGPPSPHPREGCPPKLEERRREGGPSHHRHPHGALTRAVKAPPSLRAATGPRTASATEQEPGQCRRVRASRRRRTR